ncbi:MAG: type II toxin-antitoxin system Phd/YefM family antitoxin [Oceanibaculum nanhaiense]|jgi:prevent-host-death family protein|uniref:type II toxin-antitoxin system Phd/YefM family antitoxin n=1 Tax=Oceanibaculum nanhaiense TaxID=1909734 RepID=UPI0032ECB39C
MKQVNIHQAKTHLSRLLEAVEAGEEIVIARSGVPVARLTPYAPDHAPRQPGALKGRIRIAKDFDAPLPDALAEAFGTAPSGNSA